MRTFIAALSLAACVAAPARAQDQADNPDKGFVAKARRWVEEKKIAEKIAPREGLYARFGGMTTGSGLAVGPGYRRYFRDDDMFVDFSGALSTKVYKALDAEARWARFWGDRIELWTDLRYRDYPEEDFFGLGEHSSRDTRTTYSIESTDVVGRALINVASWLRVGADIGYFNPDVGHGADSELPSIEEVFDEAAAPGLTDQPEFLHNMLFAEADTRDQRGSPTRGGFYRAAFSTWEDVSLEQYDHHRFDAEAAQFVAVAGPKHVVGVRVGLSYVNNETGHLVPFYFLPYIGGADTVRGFREFRFRDENILYLNAEYRWRVIPYLDIAPFVDAGEVRPDWEDIGPAGLKTSFGIGFRVKMEDRTFVRLDIGTGGGEGTRVFFKFGPSF